MLDLRTQGGALVGERHQVSVEPLDLLALSGEFGERGRAVSLQTSHFVCEVGVAPLQQSQPGVPIRQDGLSLVESGSSPLGFTFRGLEQSGEPGDLNLGSALA